MTRPESERARPPRERAPRLEAALQAVRDAREDPSLVVHLLADYPDEEDAEAFLLGGHALLALGRVELAREAFEAAERLDPGNAEAAVGLAASARRAAARRPVVHWHVGRAVPPAPRGVPLAVAAFAAFASAAAAFAGVALVLRGAEGAVPAWSLIATASMGLAVAAGLARRTAVAWWAGEGFAMGGGTAALASVGLVTASHGPDVVTLGLGFAAFVVASALGLVLWRDRGTFIPEEFPPHGRPASRRADG